MGPIRQKVESVTNTLKEDERAKKIFSHVSDYRVEFFLGALIFLGIILTFFFIHFGSVLIGVGIGLSFHKEISDFLYALRSYSQKVGTFKTLLLIALAIYLLLVLPAFLLSAIVGFGLASFAVKITSNAP